MKTKGKGSFNSESTDAFLVRHILKQMNQIFSCTWNFEICLQKWLKSVYKLRMASSLTTRLVSCKGEEHCYWKPNNLWKIVSFICLRSWQMPQYFLKKATFIKYYLIYFSERYHSIDTKMKGNPLSLEEMILMTIYS